MSSIDSIRIIEQIQNVSSHKCLSLHTSCRLFTSPTLLRFGWAHFTGVAARAAVWTSGQADWFESILRAPLTAGPTAAAAGTDDSANWGEYHLQLERVAAVWCLLTRTI